LIKSAEEFVSLRLSEKPDEYLRAAWEEAPLSVWFEVIKQYPDIKFWVAQNKTIPVEVLKILADDHEWRVRSMVASKNKITEEIQLKLAKDLDPAVRQRVVNNKKATLAVLKILAIDEDEEIKDKALQRIATMKSS
jgi:hypothetical protein